MIVYNYTKWAHVYQEEPRRDFQSGIIYTRPGEGIDMSVYPEAALALMFFNEEYP